MDTECASCEVRTGLQVLLQVASISQLTGADCLDNVGSLISHNPIGLQGLLRGYLYFMETESASCGVRTGL
jgi:hypothetical protein